jgi:hypothetical protein
VAPRGGTFGESRRAAGLLGRDLALDQPGQAGPGALHPSDRHVLDDVITELGWMIDIALDAPGGWVPLGPVPGGW